MVKRARWSLTLTCGHVEVRPAAWREQSMCALWPPSWARCSTCEPGLCRWRNRVVFAELRVGGMPLVLLRFTPKGLRRSRRPRGTNLAPLTGARV